MAKHWARLREYLPYVKLLTEYEGWQNEFLWIPQKKPSFCDYTTEWVKLTRVKRLYLMNSKILVVGGGCYLLFFDLFAHTKKVYSAIHKENGLGVSCFAVDESSMLVAVADKALYSCIRILSYPSLRIICSLTERRQGPIECLAFGIENILFSLRTSPNYIFTIWDYRLKVVLYSLDDVNAPVPDSAFLRSASKNIIACCVAEQFGDEWNVSCWRVCKSADLYLGYKNYLSYGPKKSISDFCFGEDCNYIIAVTYDGEVYQADTDTLTGELLFKCKSACKLKDGEDKYFRRYFVKRFMNGIIIRKPCYDIDYLVCDKDDENWSLVWSRTFKMQADIVTTDGRSKILGWTANAGVLFEMKYRDGDFEFQTIHRSGPEVLELTLIHPQDRLLLTLHVGGRFYIWTVDTGLMVADMHLSFEVKSVYPNPNQPFILATEKVGTVHGFSFQRPTMPRRTKTIKLCPEPIDDVVFTSDGELVIVSQRKTSRVFLLKISGNLNFEVNAFLELSADEIDAIGLCYSASRNLSLVIAAPSGKRSNVQSGYIDLYRIPSLMHVGKYSLSFRMKNIGNSIGLIDSIFVMPVRSSKYFRLRLLPKGVAQLESSGIETKHSMGIYRLYYNGLHCWAYGPDGMVYIRANPFDPHPYIKIMPHHRFDGGVRHACLNKLGNFLFSIGSDDIIVASRIGIIKDMSGKMMLHLRSNEGNVRLARPVVMEGGNIDKSFVEVRNADKERVRKMRLDSNRRDIKQIISVIRRELKLIVKKNKRRKPKLKLPEIEFDIDSKYKEALKKKKAEEWEEKRLHMINEMQVWDNISELIIQNIRGSLDVNKTVVKAFTNSNSCDNFCADRDYKKDFAALDPEINKRRLNTACFPEAPFIAAFPPGLTRPDFDEIMQQFKSETTSFNRDLNLTDKTESTRRDSLLAKSVDDKSLDDRQGLDKLGGKEKSPSDMSILRKDDAKGQKPILEMSEPSLNLGVGSEYDFDVSDSSPLSGEGTDDGVEEAVEEDVDEAVVDAVDEGKLLEENPEGVGETKEDNNQDVKKTPSRGTKTSSAKLELEGALPIDGKALAAKRMATAVAESYIKDRENKLRELNYLRVYGGLPLSDSPSMESAWSYDEEDETLGLEEEPTTEAKVILPPTPTAGPQKQDEEEMEDRREDVDADDTHDDIEAETRDEISDKKDAIKRQSKQGDLDFIEADYEVDDPDLVYGSSSHKLVKIPNYQTSQYESSMLLFRSQSAIARRTLYLLQEKFNMVLEELMELKTGVRRDLEDNSKKYDTMIDELRELCKVTDPVEDPPKASGWDQYEKTELLTVAHEFEIPYKPYVSPSQLDLLEKRTAEETKRRQAMDSDAFKEYALFVMMDGVLRVRWEDHLKYDIEIPECIVDERDPATYNEDEIRQVNDYHRKVEILNNERKEFSKVVMERMANQRIVMENIMRKFDLNIKAVSGIKRKFLSAFRCEKLKIFKIQEKQFQYIRLCKDRDELSRELNETSFKLIQLNKSLFRVRICMSKIENTYCKRLVQDKDIAKSFEKQLKAQHLSFVASNTAERLFKKRILLRNTSKLGTGLLTDVVLGLRNSTKGELITQQMWVYLEKVMELDHPDNCPASLPSSFWPILTDLRRRKIISELLLQIVENKFEEAKRSVITASNLIYSQKAKLEKIKDHLKQNYQDTLDLLDTEQFQIILPSFFMEMKTSGSRDDLRYSRFLHKSIVCELGDQLASVGREIVKDMKVYLERSLEAQQLDWEHSFESKKTRDLQHYLSDVERRKFDSYLKKFLKTVSKDDQAKFAFTRVRPPAGCIGLRNPIRRKIEKISRIRDRAKMEAEETRKKMDGKLTEFSSSDEEDMAEVGGEAEGEAAEAAEARPQTEESLEALSTPDEIRRLPHCGYDLETDGSDGSDVIEVGTDPRSEERRNRFETNYILKRKKIFDKIRKEIEETRNETIKINRQMKFANQSLCKNAIIAGHAKASMDLVALAELEQTRKERQQLIQTKKQLVRELQEVHNDVLLLKGELQLLRLSSYPILK